MVLDTLDKHELLQRYIADPSLITKEKYFLPSKLHPFYTPICDAKIPLNKHGQPSLLLHNLPSEISADSVKGFEGGSKRKRDEEEDVDVVSVDDADDNAVETTDSHIQYVHQTARATLKRAAELDIKREASMFQLFHYISECSQPSLLCSWGSLGAPKQEVFTKCCVVGMSFHHS